MKILLDMNIPLKYEPLLAKKGVDPIRWSEIGSPGALDTEIMAYARSNNLVLLTFDLDFGTILSTTHDSKPSVIQLRISILHAQQAVDYIAAALLKNAAELDAGAVLSIDIKKARVRLLPL
jgi:predicted nuclease of predicted toxin-antitoxin system